MKTLLGASLTMAVLVTTTGSVAGESGGGEKILDQYSYWRSHYTLRPARLSIALWKKEGRDEG
jgi:hypothetical protein